MLRLYYTGALNRGDEQQTESSKSLGGLISATVVPNNFLGNIFPEITLLSKLRNKEIVRVVALKNETGGDLSNIDFWFEFSEDPHYDIQVGAVTPTLNSCDYYQVQRITSQYSYPYNVDFYSANGQENAVSLGALLNNHYIVLFLKASLTTKGKSALTDSDIQSNYEDNVTLPDKETVIMKFDYIIDESISGSVSM